MGRFTIVALFEQFVQEFTVDDWDEGGLMLTHNQCGLTVCSIDRDDTLGDLLVTANNHEC